MLENRPGNLLLPCALTQKTSRSGLAEAIVPYETSTIRRIASVASTGHIHRRFPSALNLLAAKFAKLSFETHAATESNANFANRNLNNLACRFSGELFLFILVHFIVERIAQCAACASIQTNPKRNRFRTALPDEALAQLFQDFARSRHNPFPPPPRTSFK